LSTINERDPLKILERFEDTPVTIIVVAIETKRAPTGKLEKKGDWVKSLWHLALSIFSEAEGCRLSWNTVFFVIANQKIESIRGRLQQILMDLRDQDLESLCILSEASGTPSDKLKRLDDMLGEVSLKRNFGSNVKFHCRFLDGTFWSPS
jgi:hypothetical protein